MTSMLTRWGIALMGFLCLQSTALWLTYTLGQSQGCVASRQTFVPAQRGEAIEWKPTIVLRGIEAYRTQRQRGEPETHGYIALMTTIGLRVELTTDTQEWVITLIDAEGRTSSLWGTAQGGQGWIPVRMITPY